MEDDASNGKEAVVYIEGHEDDDPDGGEKRPIMLLLRQLIRNKQSPVKTTQIIDILQSEFNICVKSSHDLESDIYIKIIKKYLKDWPQWKELICISSKLNKIRDYEAVTQVLNHKYKNLKEYLRVMLEAAKPLVKEAKKTITPENTKMEEIDSSDVVMEIHCTKDQLNHLFFRKPQLDLNNTIFNSASVAPSRISLKSLSFKQILYGGCVKLYINLPNFGFEREISYKLKHVLVNKVRNVTVVSPVSLPTCLRMRQCNHNSKIFKCYNRDAIMKKLINVLVACATESYELYSTVYSLFAILISELKDTFDTSTQYKVPGTYRRFANNYNYVRYLYAENDQSNESKYDLQLEETVTPTYIYYIDKIGKIEHPIPPITEWLKLECQFCKSPLPMVSLNWIETLESHFNDVHSDEVDWQCTNCKRLFSIDFLMDNKWFHEC